MRPAEILHPSSSPRRRLAPLPAVPLPTVPLPAVAALAAAILGAACASTGAHLNEEGRETPVAVPADRLWLELEDVYRDLGLPIASTDPRGRTIRSGNVPLQGGVLAGVPGGDPVSCPALPGAPGAGSEAGVMLRVTTTLRPVDGSTDVVSRVEAWRTAGGTRPRPIECRSTGVLERRIAELLRRRS